MAETRRKFDRKFREGAVRRVRDAGEPVAQVARELGMNAGTLRNWVAKAEYNPGDLHRFKGQVHILDSQNHWVRVAEHDHAEHEGTRGLSTGDRGTSAMVAGGDKEFQPGDLLCIRGQVHILDSQNRWVATMRSC